MKRFALSVAVLLLALASAGCAPDDPLTGRAASDLPPGPLQPINTDPDADAPRCKAFDISRGNTRTADDADFTELVFTNSGDAACTAHGYPTLTMLNASGRNMGERATLRTNGGARYVVIQPGESVVSLVRYPKVQTCEGSASRIEVLIPGATERAFVTETHAYCPGWSVTSMDRSWPDDTQ